MRLNVFLVSIVVLSCIGCDDGQQGENGRATLPYLGLHETTDENGDPVKDTLYYQVPKFSFVDHDSLIISHNDYAGHIYVADFFFTHCPSICPRS
jgi:protein SCO1